MPVSSLEIAITAASYFLIERQHALESLLFAGDRIDQRPAFLDRKPRLQRSFSFDRRLLPYELEVDGA